MGNINKNNYELIKVEEEIKKKLYKLNPSKISYMTNDSDVETIYVGSRKKNSRMFLRIYDKKKEQLL